jgi:hypothetical protein
MDNRARRSRSTSALTQPVAPLGLTVNDPPTQSDVQTIANKVDELLGAL